MKEIDQNLMKISVEENSMPIPTPIFTKIHKVLVWHILLLSEAKWVSLKHLFLNDCYIFWNPSDRNQAIFFC